MLFPCVKFVPTMALPLDKSSSSRVPRFLSSPSLLLRSNSVRYNLLPTLEVTMVNSGPLSSFDASICRCYSSMSPSESAQEKTIPCGIDVVIDSVVKIFSFCNKPNVFQPWQKSWEVELKGSGFVISGRRILTNAHIVDNHSYVQVRKHGSPTRCKANVEVVGYECNLAILTIDSEEFWEEMNCLELGNIPYSGETVSIFCYPHDGDTISVTKYTVSGVEVQEYMHGSSLIDLLTIEIDGVIDRGKSGGPVVMENKVVGVAFRGRYFSQVIGYIIPTSVIKHFLSGVEENGQYIGFGSLNVYYQPMVNAQIRKHFKMNHEMTGVLINTIRPLSYAQKVLKKDDVILAIDDIPIENDGTVLFRGKEWITFDHFVSMKKPGETALLKVLRDGRKHEFNICDKPVLPLVPERQLYPSYYIFAGFVFVPFSVPYIDEHVDMCYCAIPRMTKTAGEQFVIISQVLSDDINIGYANFKDLEVKKVNGVEVMNLKHLCELIEKSCTEDLRLDLEDERVIILNYKSAKEATSLILEQHGIQLAMSKDLQRERDG